MKLAVHVKPNAPRDQLWREGEGLLAAIRAVPHDGAANEYLVRFLSGSLRVAGSAITITRGRNSRYKLISIKASESDLKPMLDALPPAPRAGLFEASE